VTRKLNREVMKLARKYAPLIREAKIKATKREARSKAKKQG
jgi:hypothetical protein